MTTETEPAISRLKGPWRVTKCIRLIDMHESYPVLDECDETVAICDDLERAKAIAGLPELRAEVERLTAMWKIIEDYEEGQNNANDRPAIPCA